MQSRYRVRPGWLGSILLRREGPWFFFFFGGGVGGGCFLMCTLRQVEKGGEGRGEGGRR